MAGINVKLTAGQKRSYHIVVRSGLITDIPRMIKRLGNVGSVFVITDENVGRLYGRRCVRELHNAGFKIAMLDVPAGESSKKNSMLQVLYNQLLTLRVRRDSVIIAIGGGVVGDLAGFIAATILRGVRYVQVPTTLLSQVDSSVGGKVGIDHKTGKNLIGAFYPPEAVYIDPSVLKTLPVSEFRAGLAEVVKIAATLDPRFFRLLESEATALSKGEESRLSGIIQKSVSLKAAIVQKDQFESGLRKVLNVGHTIGHALESASGFTLKHGNAVAIGLVAESRIACAMGIMKEETLRRIESLVRALRLPHSIPVTNQRRFRSALSADKKGDNAGAQFVLLRDIGKSVIGVRVPSQVIEKVVFKKSR